MSKKDRESLTRSENVRREQRMLKQKKLDRLLNLLIAIVVLLIFINLYIIFSGDDDKEIAQEQSSEAKIDKPVEKRSNVTTEEDEEDMEQETSEMKHVSQVEIFPSDDPLVEELLIDASWQPTPTSQTGEHISTYKKGDIDYEEKLVTFLSAVQLQKEEVIFWSVRSYGSTDTSKAVLSTKDKSKIYRVSIEWVNEQGWKPVKVEKLKQLEGAF